MSVRIRKLKSCEITEFKELTVELIGQDYADIDESFADIIVDAHQNEYDPLGYFTKTKTIWAADLDGEMIGFLVGTEKRGGSVKLLPGIVKEGYRQEGYGTEMWKQVEEKYRERGHRKVYNHGMLNRDELLYWVTGMGMHVEAHLREQYTEGRDEYVAGRFLNKDTDVSPPKPNILDSLEADFEVRFLEDDDKDEFESLILSEMTPWYDEIDEDFVQSILNARNRFEQGFKEKGKRVFVVESGGDLVGCCVATPKRGGSVKLVPLLFNENGTLEMAHQIVEEMESYFSERGNRKLYAMVPQQHLSLSEVLKQQDFQVEGLIREPYKPGIDNVFMGKLI